MRKVLIEGIASNDIEYLKKYFEITSQQVGCTKLVPLFGMDIHYGYIDKYGTMTVTVGELVIGADSFPEGLLDLTILHPAGVSTAIAKQQRSEEIRMKIFCLQLEVEKLTGFIESLRPE